MARPQVHDQDTADALVDAAARRLAAGGPAAVTVRRVADDVDVSTRAVYSLFGSRDDLLADLYRRGFQALEHELSASSATDDPLADLRVLGEAYRRSARARPALYAAMFQWDRVDEETEAGRQAEATFEILVRAVGRCVDAGLLAGDPTLLARQLWALTHGLVLLEARGSLGDEPDRVWERALPAIARGNAGPVS